MNKSKGLAAIAVIIGIAVLLALGTWQLYRLAWKEQLIARIEARAQSDAVSLAEIESRWQNNSDVSYFKLTATGRFDHDGEIYYFNTWQSQAGWNVITPFHLEGEGLAGKILLVNRGFIPQSYRNGARKNYDRTAGVVTIVALARNPVDEKPNTFVPDNLPDKRELFWKSHLQMIALLDNDIQTDVLPFTVDVQNPAQSGTYPVAGTTRRQFANNHLQYAITWYGLALSLLVVGTVFLFSKTTTPNRAVQDTES